MPLSPSDIDAMRLLLKEEVRDQLDDHHAEVRERFDRIDEALDGLYQRDEKREQEYLVIKHQLEKLEKKCA